MIHRTNQRLLFCLDLSSSRERVSVVFAAPCFCGVVSQSFIFVDGFFFIQWRGAGILIFRFVFLFCIGLFIGRLFHFGALFLEGVIL